MKNTTTVVTMMLPILLAGVIGYAQEPIRPKVLVPIPLDQRVAALEQRVSTLEQQRKLPR